MRGRTGWSATRSAAAIEFVPGPLSFESPGATTSPSRGSTPISPFRPVAASEFHHRGDRQRTARLRGTVQAAQSGLRATSLYAGGLAGNPVLGSLSHDSLSAGTSATVAGDRVPIGTLGGRSSYGGRLAETTATPDGSATHLRITVLPGPRDGPLAAGWEQITSSTWTVSMASDRPGCASQDPPSNCPRIISPRASPWWGGIEVPPDGQPVILGPDHPTTGGYPVIGVVNPRQRCPCSGSARQHGGHALTEPANLSP